MVDFCYDLDVFDSSDGKGILQLLDGEIDLFMVLIVQFFYDLISFISSSQPIYQFSLIDLSFYINTGE